MANIEACLLVVFVILHTFHCLYAIESPRIKRSGADTTTHRPEDTTENDCPPPPTNDGSNAHRRKRSERYLSNTTEENETEEDTSHLSNEFKKCVHVTLGPHCYEKRPDGSVYVPGYKREFPRSDNLIRDGYLYICPNFFPKLPDNLAIISVVGSSVSTICLVLHIIAYIAIPTPKNLPSRCLLSLCVALLLAYVFTFSQEAAIDDVSCRVVGMSMVYFFLASFFWMNVFSYEVWRSIRLATTKLRMTKDRPMMVRFACYSAYAWGSPLLFSLLSIIVHHLTSNEKYRLLFNKNICWFEHKEAMVLYFVGPLFTLLGINVLLTASSFWMISNASMRSDCGKESFDLRARLCLSLRLGSSMGLTWIFGVLAVVTLQVWLWYFFAFGSALQGVFIFLSFTVSESSRKDWKKAWRRVRCAGTPLQSLSSNPPSSV